MADRPPSFLIEPAATSAAFAEARRLFADYIGGLGLDLTFQNVEKELADLPGKYAEPDGIILLARDQRGQAVGCVALRPLAEAGSCEMKRLYLLPEGRGQGLGRRLSEAVLEAARARGYQRMRLDTLPSMQVAQAIYRELGFVETPAYYDNPISETVYMALDLRRPQNQAPS